MAKNLLKNPNAEDKLDYWDIEDGGSHWNVETIPGTSGHQIKLVGVSKYFATSFKMCTKSQEINLLAEGFSPKDLESQPVVDIEDWFSGRTDSFATYKITVKLLDEKKNVLGEVYSKEVSLSPDDSSWTQVKHSFSDYGLGLRYIFFEHGGQSTGQDIGWYGARVTGSSVKLYSPLHQLTKY